LSVAPTATSPAALENPLPEPAGDTPTVTVRRLKTTPGRSVAYIMQHVKIPQDRIGVLIGDGGETMREIEERAEVRLDIDSETGSVRVESVGDPITGLKGPDVVKAIGRGFAPEDALALLEGDMMMFDIVDVKAASRNKSDLRRHKGRLIGEDGRTRELMEQLTGASVVIYGSTLAIIGGPEQVDAVREAAEMIIDGAPHGSVYSFLERRHNEMKHNELEYHQFTG
jgi:ribosomal RNA assembly protein